MSSYPPQLVPPPLASQQASRRGSGSQRSGQSSHAHSHSVSRAAKAEALSKRLATFQNSNYNDDGSLGLFTDPGLYIDVEGGGPSGGRRTLSGSTAAPTGGGGRRKGGGGGHFTSATTTTTTSSSSSSSSSSGMKRGQAVQSQPPWVRVNRIRRLPEALLVDLGAAPGEDGRPMTELVTMPTLAFATSVVATLKGSVSSGSGSGSSSSSSGGSGSAALVQAESVVKFLAAASTLPRYPPRHFCVVCGSPGRYPFPGSLEYICSIKCKEARAAM